MIKPKQIKLVQALIEAISNSQFKTAEGLTKGDLSAEEIERQVTDYSEITRTKISQPGEGYLEGPGVFDTGLDDHEGLNPYRYVTIDLWFDGAPSDLSAEIEVQEDEQGQMFLTLRNIHVM